MITISILTLALWCVVSAIVGGFVTCKLIDAAMHSDVVRTECAKIILRDAKMRREIEYELEELQRSEYEELVLGVDPEAAEMFPLERLTQTILAMPGWNCPHCGVFNGEVKETLHACRSCDTKRPEWLGQFVEEQP